MAYTINTGAGLGATYSNITLNGGGTATTYTINPSVSVTGPMWTTAADSAVLASTSGRTIHVKGDAEFEGNVVIQGRDLGSILATLESRLGVLQPNPELEAEFDELKALGDAYREAEKRFNEQKRVFEILKTQDK